jgi:molybdenum cofactor cytidylyltransferase
MKARAVEIKESTGRILSTTIFRPGGRKLLAKGHVLSEDDIRLLENEGLDEVCVAELEDGEIAEDEAVSQVASEIGCGCLEIRLAAGGRANLFTTEDCCMLVDDELLKQINCAGSVMIATTPNFGFARGTTRIATVKSAPFAVDQAQLEATITMVRERGPLLQARPIRTAPVAVLYTDPIHGERARSLFEAIMLQRLQRFSSSPSFVLAVAEEEQAVARSLQHLLRAKPAVILIASTTAPSGPEDVIGRAMLRAGCQFERFMAPVEPGNLFLLSYFENVPIISAPGCFRSAKPNVVDLVLPPLLARYRVSSWEVAGLGHGGLLG